MIEILQPSKISIAALSIAKKYAEELKDPCGTHTHVSLRPVQSLVGLACGSEYNMAMIYAAFEDASHETGIENPLIPTPHPHTQYAYCRSKAQMVDKHIYKPTKPFAIIDSEMVAITPSLLRQGDIFLLQTKEGLWHCGFIVRTDKNRAVTLETSTNGLRYLRRDPAVFSKIIRVSGKD